MIFRLYLKVQLFQVFCSLDSFFNINARCVFRTLSNIYDEAFFPKTSTALSNKARYLNLRSKILDKCPR